ncbi:MAG: DUF456 domain-containing protein [Lentisphaerae bacterium]|nr:DUF456 domain-containing protein [Lentisphaerota bacterium]
MTESAGILSTLLGWLGILGVSLLCLAGVVLSAFSVSGTWLVAGAAALAALVREGFPGWGTVAVFAVISLLVEGAEAVAGAWGVKRRGGSGLAAAAAVLGGLLGLLLGTLIPVPVAGSLLGMIVGSYALAFAVEARRLRNAEQAASIARGTVLARLAVILLKLAATLGMIGWLAAGMLMAE